MKEELLNRLAAVSAEEEQILRGGLVDKKLYSYRAQGFHIDAERILSPQQLIAMRMHTRFAPFPAHCHDYIEIMYVCSGSVTHIIEGGHTACIKEGELLFLRSGTGHALQKAALNDVAINFIIKPQFLDSVFDAVGSQNMLWSLLFNSAAAVPYLHFKVSEIVPVQNILENLAYLLLEKQGTSQRILQQTMTLLFLHLLSCSKELCNLPDIAKSTSLVANVLREINENYRTASLTKLAQQNKISMPYLCSEIHKATGQTYKQLLCRRRMEKAAQLLRSTEMPVEEIIQSVGYSNTSYFYRAFKEMYGISPKLYRQS